MIAAAILLSSVAVTQPNCTHLAATRSTTASERPVRHVFQNGERFPLRLEWIDPQGKRVDLGMIAPGAYKSLNSFVGHVFALTDAEGRCRRLIRIDDLSSGTYAGTSRYHPVAVRPGWQVFIDRALSPAADPARTAVAMLARLLAQAEAVLPPVALAQLRTTPIFLHEHSGAGAMFHPEPDWLVAHGRTVELLNGIELADAGIFIDYAMSQPGFVLHELAHAYHARLSAEDRAEIEATYNQAMQSGLYRAVKRTDGSTAVAYARYSPMEYFAELSSAYFARSDYYPFTRADLAAYDPVGERLIARLWHNKPDASSATIPTAYAPPAAEYP